MRSAWGETRAKFRRMVLSSIVAATAACGAAVPATGGPRAAAPDKPLVAYELKDDADVARAMREHYTKFEYRIAMRDGVRLFTSVYVPKDESRSYPLLMQRTPYGVFPYGIDTYPGAQNAREMRRISPLRAYIREGYILVFQDVRGRLMSEGTFVDVRPIVPQKKHGDIDESTDAFDTIEWLVHHVPRNNGRVGILGISYPGFYAAQAAVEAHPALKAVSPQAPVTDWFLGDDFYHNGAFFLADAFDFVGNFGRPRPKLTKKMDWKNEHDAGDVYDFFLALGPLSRVNREYMKDEVAFWKDLSEHTTLDAFWKARNPRPHYRNIKPAVLTVGGWFDAEDLFGALETYRSIERQSKNENSLVMGPWKHGGWARSDGEKLGDVSFGAKTSVFYREQIEFPFFERHLRQKSVPAPPEAWVFETGTNEWRRFDAWPPRNVTSQTWWLGPRGELTNVAPPGDDGSFDEYVSDPQRPVPYHGRLSHELEDDYMTADQRFATRRPDVLSYVSPELDADVALAGPIEANLWVSTTGTDADFIVKIVDVYPSDLRDPDPNPTNMRMGGYQQLVRGEVMRGRFRNGFEKPEPFRPGEPALVRFSLPDVLHVFRSGHRIMVQVQSSWFPLVDRNPQTFVDIWKATESDFRTATQRVFRAPGRASMVRVPVLRGSFAGSPSR